MAVSGSIGGGLTAFTTDVVVDHAFRGVRLPPQSIAGEEVDLALSQLNMMLSSWANEGAPLWAQTRYILAMKIGVYQLDVSQQLPGVIDILEANLRQLTRLTGTYAATEGNATFAFDSDPATACVQVTPAGNITMSLTTAAKSNNIGILPNATGTWNISLQYSDDGVVWTNFYTNAALAVVAGQFVWLDFQANLPHTNWRLQANGTTVLNVAEMFWGDNPSEIKMARINVDDYWDLPNKQFQGRPLQYWCDRQVAGPVMWLWPSPGNAFIFNQITVLAHRQIMDTTSMSGNIEVPQRAFDAVWMSLSERLRILLPQVDKQATMDIPDLARNARKLFWGEERDDSPINLNLDISAYTA